VQRPIPTRASLIPGEDFAGLLRLQCSRLERPEILGREFIVYDALYEECKRRVLAAEK